MMAAMAKNSKVKGAKAAAKARAKTTKKLTKKAEKAALKEATRQAKKAGKKAGKKAAKKASTKGKDKPEKPTGDGLPATAPVEVVESAGTEESAAKLTKEVKKDAGVKKRFSEVLAFTRGDQLADISPDSTPGFAGDQKDGEEALADCTKRLGQLQERLFAESKGGGKRSVLLVIQGMDTSGKGGILDHVVGGVGPQGVKITSFKAPSAEERAHDFLWRIENALPGPGQIGVFDRSHYEDVLIVKVHAMVPGDVLRRRYTEINAFERKVAAAGTTIVKVMLHISADEQKARLLARLADPEKQWKYNPGDVTERAHWDEYQAAYQVALTRCSTKTAPWHVVPANNKWYARLAVQQLLLEAMTDMAPVFPAASYDLEVETERVKDS